MIPAAFGFQPDFLAWLWSLNNEHRVPFPKLLYVGLLRLWADFRVGMVVNIVLLVVVSAAFVIVVRRLRGHTRWTDAFFPLVLLHLGHWENFGWSWEITFVLATVLACGILLAVASGRSVTTLPRAALLGACLVLIPLSGATALPFAPIMAVVMLIEARKAVGRVRTVVIVAGSLSLALTVISMVGIRRPPWIPPSPGLAEDARTGVKVLALAFGPAAGAWWFIASLITLVVFGAAAYLLLKTRAWSLLAFLGGSIVLAALIGHGRASLLEHYGLPDRYVLIVVPGLCCVYLAFEHGRRSGIAWARYGQAFLCTSLLALYPLNAAFGVQFRDWYHDRLDPFAADIAAGMSFEQLSYFRTIAADVEEMRLGMSILHDRKVGVFARLNRAGPGIAPVRRIDGLDTPDPSDWVTVGDTSTATLDPQDEGMRVSWAYDVADTWAVVGRSFDPPLDWRGVGAISLDITSEGSGDLIRIRLGVAGPGGSVDRYESAFVDDQVGRRSITIPWNGFGHVDPSGVYDLQGPLPLDQIVSVSLIATQPGRGAMGIDRISLVPGHGQIGWPLHPSAVRRSLPPWR